jgi:hypothetical protein
LGVRKGVLQFIYPAVFALLRFSTWMIPLIFCIPLCLGCGSLSHTTLSPQS